MPFSRTNRFYVSSLLAIFIAWSNATFAETVEAPKTSATEETSKVKPRDGDAGETAGDDDPALYVDDEAFMVEFTAKLTALAKKNKCAVSNDIEKGLKANKCKLGLCAPGTRALSPEEVYEQAVKSVFLLGSIESSDLDPDTWEPGRVATAWAVTDDGVMVTNRHVFEDLKEERFAVANIKGEVFPVIEVLASSSKDDVAIFRVAGKGFTPLPIARDEKVGAWVGVLSHPGNQLFSFTQGFVTRYTRATIDGKPERWMAITADFAGGSSGGPVLNKFGAVVGIATNTENIDLPFEDEINPVAATDTPGKGGKKPEPRADTGDTGYRGSSIQMIVKTTVPSRALRELIRK